ncbi:ribosomal protein L1p/L10e family-domain-containing protein [Chytridium lagenaria]|nr:ribosomal protein L1p/L10e family-domain-containing protein [Chytridium lagenaria]
MPAAKMPLINRLYLINLLQTSTMSMSPKSPKPSSHSQRPLAQQQRPLLPKRRPRAPKYIASTDPDWIWAHYNLKQIGLEFRLPPCRIPLKHGLYTEDAEFCVFTKDPQQDFEQLFEKQEVKAEILSMKKLKTNYNTKESRMELEKTYQYFLTDSRIIHLLPKVMSEKLFKKKHPIPIEIGNTIKDEVEAAKSSTYLQLGFGLSHAVKIGSSALTHSQISENILHSIDAIIHLLPKRWSNIKSLHIKTNSSAALQLYPLPGSEEPVEQVPSTPSPA